MPLLPRPPSGPDAVSWVAEHLGHLTCDEPHASAVRGGQVAADAALAGLDLTGYARRRSQVLPESARGASRMSPYLRYGLVTLPQVWQAAGSAPPADRSKYRDELLWQEYARHLYARIGSDLWRSLRTEPQVTSTQDPWRRDMACMDLVVGDLETDGWLVNQTRMWLASQWTVRGGRDWRVEGQCRKAQRLTHRQDAGGAAAGRHQGRPIDSGADLICLRRSSCVRGCFNTALEIPHETHGGDVSISGGDVSKPAQFSKRQPWLVFNFTSKLNCRVQLA